MIDYILDFISGLLGGWNVPAEYNRQLTTLTALAVAVGVSWCIYLFLSRVIGRVVRRLVKFTSVTWDDMIFNDKVLQSIWRFALSLMLLWLVPPSLSLYAGIKGFALGLCRIISVLAMVMILVRMVSALHDLTLTDTRLRTRSLKGIFQMVQLVVIVIGAIIVISILIGRDPVFVLSGLGAAAAVIMLVFQDSILGLVAGIQLTANDMLRPGDWISAPKCNANGIVLEVTLNTVKVQNFDMTIITIPPYTLVKDSFQNWRGMLDSRGRRIMRSINIDMTTVRRLTSDEMRRFEGQPWFTDNLRDRMGDTPVNLTLFRRYLEWTITNNSTWRSGMTTMVRELQPTPEGLPVEMYFFTSHTEWVAYENEQADMLDGVLADIVRFDLRLFQRPTGRDVAALTAHN